MEKLFNGLGSKYLIVVMSVDKCLLSVFKYRVLPGVVGDNNKV